MPVIDRAQIGLSKETTYGTRVVPAKFFEFDTESFQADVRAHVSQQLGSGATVARGSRRKLVTRSAGGGLSMEVPNKGYGSVLDLMHDNAVTPVQQGATPAYLQTHNIGLTAPTKSATIQTNRPDSTNTDRPFDYLGCMLTEVEWSIAADGALMASHTFDVQEEQTNQTLAVRSLPTGLESFVFTEGSLSIAGGAVADVTDASLSCSFARQTDFYPLGTTGLKAKPVQNAISEFTGALSARFTDLTHYNRYKNNTQVALVLSFVSPTLAGTGFPFRFTITCAQVAFTGETPTVQGPDVLAINLPYQVLYNGTNAPVVVEYMSTDVTI